MVAGSEDEILANQPIHGIGILLLPDFLPEVLNNLDTVTLGHGTILSSIRRMRSVRSSRPAR
jgi:hypothetical protein